MQDHDWDAVRQIYVEGIATGNATFETNAPEWLRWSENHPPKFRLVASDGERVFGWAALAPVSGRCVYGGVMEVSVYIASAARSLGIGRKLVQALIERSESHNVWTLQAGIFPENVASLAIHKTCGFREVGVRRKLGQLRGVWRDVLLLERRSTVVGIG
jgi:phosphinothricin acetyltransferase